MSLYFAYGSNMNQAQMRGRCPSAELIGLATLRDYALDFTIYSPLRKCGCADIVQKQGSAVHGLLYQLTGDDLKKLDDFEGHPIHYRRISVTVVQNGEEKEAFSYEVTNKTPGLKPSKEYLSLLQTAARDFDFPETYRSFLASFL